MNLCIVSGKGGTGKTTLSVSLATLLAEEEQRPVFLLDCDVEEPNAHLYLTPPNVREEDVTALTPHWNEERCLHCGACKDLCQFGALAIIGERVEVFAEHCHSCGACVYACPAQALEEAPRSVGRLFQGRAQGVELSWGELHIGEPRAVPVIEAVRRRGVADTVLIDGPPGTACALVAAAAGADAALVVTEPTLFGQHDLELALDVLETLAVPRAVVINKSLFNTGSLRDWCEERGVPVLLEIPFRRDFAEQQSHAGILQQAAPEWRPALQQLWLELETLARQGRQRV